MNYSDVGHYTLRDRRDRVVSVTRMDLTGGLSLFVPLVFLRHSMSMCLQSEQLTVSGKILKWKASFQLQNPHVLLSCKVVFTGVLQRVFVLTCSELWVL